MVRKSDVFSVRFSSRLLFKGDLLNWSKNKGGFAQRSFLLIVESKNVFDSLFCLLSSVIG